MLGHERTTKFIFLKSSPPSVSPGVSAPVRPPHQILSPPLVQQLLDAFVLRSLAERRHPWNEVALLPPADVGVQPHDPVRHLLHLVLLLLGERDEERR